MAIYYVQKNKPLAQELRRNMTRQERRLWYDFLANYPIRFRRQKQFGRYIVDFYCSGAKMVIEIDGSQHFTEAGLEYDGLRTAYLTDLGIRVLRIPNTDIDRRFDSVCEWIDQNVNTRLRDLKRKEGTD